jgi:hypothetical protein
MFKRELNHIYTQPPYECSGGVDFGWFCREHALHTFATMKLLGLSAEICIGDIIVRTPEITLTSVGETSDHAWCNIGEFRPVDLSVTLKHLSESQDISIVYGSEDVLHSPFKVLVVSEMDEGEFMDMRWSNDFCICYNEKQQLSFDPIELLKDPYAFLFSPPNGKPRFTEIHGDQIFFQVTQHCIKLLRSEVKPCYLYRNSSSTLSAIKKYNRNARRDIELMAKDRK